MHELYHTHDNQPYELKICEPKEFQFVYETSHGAVRAHLLYHLGNNDDQSIFYIQGARRIEPLTRKILKTSKLYERNPELHFFDSILWSDSDRPINILIDSNCSIVTAAPLEADQTKFYSLGFEEMAGLWKNAQDIFETMCGHTITDYIGESVGGILVSHVIAADGQTHNIRNVILINTPLNGLAAHVRTPYLKYLGKTEMLERSDAMKQLLEIDQNAYLASLRDRLVALYDNTDHLPDMWFITGYSEEPITNFVHKILPIQKYARTMKQSPGDGICDFRGSSGMFFTPHDTRFLFHPSGKIHQIVNTQENINNHDTVPRAISPIVKGIVIHGDPTHETSSYSSQLYNVPRKKYDVTQVESGVSHEIRTDGIRIAYFIKSLPGFGYKGGGAERNLERLLNGLSSEYPQEYKKTVYVINDKDSGTDYPYPGTDIYAHAPFHDVLNTRFLELSQHDIIHFGDGYALTQYLQLMKFTYVWKKPIIVRITSEDVVKKMIAMPRIFASVMFNKVDAYISQSDEISIGLKQAGIQQARIVRIDNGVDEKLFNPVNADTKINMRNELLPHFDASKLIYIYSGRITGNKKRVNELLDAWDQCQLYKKGHMLILMGAIRDEGNNNGSELYARYGTSRSFPIAGARNTYWTGLLSTDQVAKFLQISDIFVLPSTNEGFSNALIEAMACGLVPIVRRGTSGNSRVVSDSTGYFFDNEFSLAEAITQLSYSNRRIKLSENAAQIIARSFTLKSTLRAYHDLYQRVLSR